MDDINFGTKLDKTLVHNFRTTAFRKYGKSWGSVKSALDEAMRKWIEENGGDPDAPIPFFVVQHQASKLTKGLEI